MIAQGTYSKLVSKALAVFGSYRLFSAAMLFKYSEALDQVELQERSETVRAARGGKFELESWQRGVHLATITANGNDVDPPLGVSGSYRRGARRNTPKQNNTQQQQIPKDTKGCCLPMAIATKTGPWTHKKIW
jgi:hypothetical protein